MREKNGENKPSANNSHGDLAISGEIQGKQMKVELYESQTPGLLLLFLKYLVGSRSQTSAGGGANEVSATLQAGKAR